MSRAGEFLTNRTSAGDEIPSKCSLIEVHVAELKQLFNSIDPSPFRNRDLDPKAEDFIVGWAKDLPRNVPIALVIDLDRPAGLPNEATVLREAIHESLVKEQRCTGADFGSCFASVKEPSHRFGGVNRGHRPGPSDRYFDQRQRDWRRSFARALRSGLEISMWRPLEVFLYDWWPIRDEARLSDRLASMPVRIRYLNAVDSETWKEDWPAVSPHSEQTSK